MKAVLDTIGRIRRKSRSCTKQDLMIRPNEIWLSCDISDWKKTTRFFTEKLREMISESGLMLITCGLIFMELKRRYSFLLGLADNLIVSYQPGENIFNTRLNNSYGGWGMFRGKWNIHLNIICIKMTTYSRVFEDDS